MEIYNQIKSYAFLAIQWDETIDVTNWCQRALIFRYIVDGTVYELYVMFYGFRRGDKSPEGNTKSTGKEMLIQ